MGVTSGVPAPMPIVPAQDTALLAQQANVLAQQVALGQLGKSVADATAEELDSRGHIPVIWTPKLLKEAGCPIRTLSCD